MKGVRVQELDFTSKCKERVHRPWFTILMKEVRVQKLVLASKYKVMLRHLWSTMVDDSDISLESLDNLYDGITNLESKGSRSACCKRR